MKILNANLPDPLTPYLGVFLGFHGVFLYFRPPFDILDHFPFEQEVANWASGGSKSFDRSQNLPKFGFFQTWSEASGDVWDGFGWEKSCLYWSLLMFGSAWDCFMLTWDNFSLTHLPPTSLNHPSPFPEIMIGTESLPRFSSAILRVEDFIFWLKAPYPYSIRRFKSQSPSRKLPIEPR